MSSCPNKPRLCLLESIRGPGHIFLSLSLFFLFSPFLCLSLLCLSATLSLSHTQIHSHESTLFEINNQTLSSPHIFSLGGKYLNYIHIFLAKTDKKEGLYKNNKISREMGRGSFPGRRLAGYFDAFKLFNTNFIYYGINNKSSSCQQI